MFQLSKEVPVIHNKEELQYWLQPVYCMENYFVDKDTYIEFMNEILNLLRASYVIYNCRNCEVKFKFYKRDKKTYSLELRHFYVNIVLWYPFIELYGINILDESFIMDCKTQITNIEDYINTRLITVLRDYNVSSTTINYSISYVLFRLRYISIDFSEILGLNFSMKDFIDMYEENSEIKDIMEVTFPETMQPHEIENLLHELEDREIDIYKKHPDNPIGYLLRANAGVKHKQFAEFTIADGLKPTLNGVTVPMPIENSTILKGLAKPSHLYVSALGSRKSLLCYCVRNKLCA